MIFQHTWRQVLEKRKTQSRRLVALGKDTTFNLADEIVAVYRRSRGHSYGIGRNLYSVGKMYAVQPGRGMAAIGYIRLTAIRRERLWDISEADAKAEGCEPRDFGDGDPLRHARYAYRGSFMQLWRSIHTKPGTRWENNPDVYVLQFELVTQETLS